MASLERTPNLHVSVQGPVELNDCKSRVDDTYILRVEYDNLTGQDCGAGIPNSGSCVLTALLYGLTAVSTVKKRQQDNKI